jgi:NAD(P)H-dependent flavin oxidoreductase YrpB (nitropropane dioxygenase family)
MRTPLCERLGIEFPLFAFSHCRDVVAAVTNAGGFGVLGALAFEPEQLEIELRWIDEHVGGRGYGVDFAMPASYVGKGGGDAATVESLRALVPATHWEFAEKLLAEHGIPPLPEDAARKMKAAGLGVDAEGPGQTDVALSHPNVKLLVNALGPPPPYVISRAHAKGVWVGALVGTREHALKQVDQGVDLIVAQGTEAGGHTGEISTMVLVPDVVDAVAGRVPVLAAGGIGCGRQMAAALALGAQGAWTGSIWLTAAESETEPWVIESLLAAGPRDAVRSRAMTGKPARQLRTAWTEAWERSDAPKPLPMPLQGILYAEMAHRFVRARSKPLSGSPVGQILSRMDGVRPSRELVREMVEECVATMERMNALFAAAEQR